MSNNMILDVECPIIHEEIDIGDCTVISDVCDGLFKKEVLTKNITGVKNWREICKNCKWHGM